TAQPTDIRDPMTLSFWRLSTVITVLSVSVESVAVMSVDLGSEWMKMAIVKPGVPMEIVLNRESRRKTPAVVCLKDNERLFGDSALGSVKIPKTVYRHLQSLLGKKRDNVQVKVYEKRFPEHQLQADPVRGTVYFNSSQEMRYSPEELLAMVLNYSRGLAQDFAEQPIKDAVITVPAFFNQAERRAVLHAAQMAGLKVLQLINDNTAVALNYGVFRRKDIDGTPKNIMFYDMGSGSTTATIVTYQTVKTKDFGTQPQLQIQGVGVLLYSSKLFFQTRKDSRRPVERHFLSSFLIFSFKVRSSALNQRVEGLMDDIDFKAKVTRAEFEDLCADLFERVPGPVLDALTAAELKLEDLEQVILVGGATRVPKVQEVLLKAVGKEELGKNINADEAAALGAVYQAAALSKAFKVKPFLVRDAAIFPIQVEFNREVEEEEGIKVLKHSKRILFQRMAPYPQRKVITFNRYTDDFTFNINYGDLSFLSQEDLSIFGSLNLTTVKLSGVGESFQKHADAESKGIKAHFNMDESGVLLLDRVSSSTVNGSEELGNTISTLFGGGSSEPSPNATEPVQVGDPTPGASQEEPGLTVLSLCSGGGGSSSRVWEGGKNVVFTQEEKGGEKPESVEPEKKAKPQKRTKISEDVSLELVLHDVVDPTAEELLSSRQKLQDLTNRDLAKQEREKVLNSLEAFIFETQDKLHQEDHQQVMTEEELQQILGQLREASDWMDEDGYRAGTKELKEKLSQLRGLCRDVFFRVDERRKWPELLGALDSLLNTSAFFLRGARLIPDDDQIFTEVELNMLEKVINETTTWKNETVAEQENRSPHLRPVLLSRDIESKLALLQREMNYLLNKAKFAKPKAKAKAKNETGTDAGSKANATAEEEKLAPPTQTGGSPAEPLWSPPRPHLTAEDVLCFLQQRAPRSSRRVKLRPLRRVLLTQPLTANHSPQRKPSAKVS
uniref:Hypoxia up-regulated protein 1 n=1 Tax=Cyprinodon variegatus TaxID=28743 RepID=A0A3Q2FCG5_CYPVA